MTPDRKEVEQLRQALARAVASCCPGWTAADREDVVHDVLARVLELARRGEWNRPPNPSYLRKMAFHAAVDELRRRRFAPGSEAEAARLAAGGRDPEGAAADVELGRALADCLAMMLRDRRVAVVLSLQGHAAKELAELMGWTAKKAQNLVFRGTADLRQCLSEKGHAR